MTENTPRSLGNVITIDDERIKSHLDRVLRGSVEETLNACWTPRGELAVQCGAQRGPQRWSRRSSSTGGGRAQSRRL